MCATCGTATHENRSRINDSKLASALFFALVIKLRIDNKKEQKQSSTKSDATHSTVTPKRGRSAPS
jgi:hypothetical protein